MKYWNVRLSSDNSIHVIGSTHEPRGAEYNLVKPALMDGDTPEDARWLQVNVDVFEVNGPLKTTTQSADATAQALIDAEDALQVEVDKRVRVMDFCKELKARIAVINLSKGWDLDAWLVYQADPKVMLVSNYLTDGFLESARAYMAATDFSAYYTTPEKDGIIARMDAFIATL